MSPHDDDEIYMTTDMSTVFHSQDFGESWETIDFRELKGDRRSHVRFTVDPQVLYAIDVRDDLRKAVRSDDGGETWTELSQDPTEGELVRWLDADPQGTSRILLSNYDTLFFSSDGGTSFTQVFSVIDQGSLRIAGAFWGTQGIYVATQQGLLVSTDGGASFGQDATPGLPADEPIIGFAAAENGGTIRLIAITGNDPGSVWAGMLVDEDLRWGEKRVYRLDWGVGSWQRIDADIAANDAVYLAGMSQGDIYSVYLAGWNEAEKIPVVYHSSDGGASWSSVLITEYNQNIATGWCGDGGDVGWGWPELVMSLAVSPTDGQRAMITDYGFVHVTDDGGQSWRQAYVSPTDENPSGAPTPKGKSYEGIGLQQTSAWWLHWPDSQTILAGFSDFHGKRSTDGGAKWQAGVSLGLPHNTTYHIIAQPGSGTLYGATSSVHDIYQSHLLQDSKIDAGQGHLIVSDDAGTSWETLHDFGHPVVWLAFDPNDANTLYASVVHSAEGGIWVTHNLQDGVDASWERLAEPPRTRGHPLTVHVLEDGTLVTTYSGHLDADWSTFYEGSGVFVSSDGGTSWADRSHQDMHWWTKDLIIDPHDPNQNTWYVGVFRHWGGGHDGIGGLYRTTDRGLSWTRISDNSRVESLTIDPRNPDVAYLTTEAEGLWQTQNLTSETPVFDQDPDFPFGHPVRVFFNPFDQDEVWVASVGDGLRKKNKDSAYDSINFHDYTVSDYGVNQNQIDGTVEVEDGGAALHLGGNRWQKIDFPYTVTPNTVIEFDFRSTAQGDIHGIGFDSDLSMSADRTFQLFGTQSWGIPDFSYPGDGQTHHFVIPVGQYYQGDMSYLFFVMDHDVSPATGESVFSNVRVYE